MNNIQQREMSITTYTFKIKELCDSLGSISVNIDDDEMVQICLGGLATRFDTMRTAILAREKSPSNQCYRSKKTMCVLIGNRFVALCSATTETLDYAQKKIEIKERVHRMLMWKTQIWEKPRQPTDCKLSV